MLVYNKKVPRHFYRISIVTRVLPSGDSEIRGPIVRTAKTNTILNGPRRNSSQLKIYIMALTKQIRKGAKVKVTSSFIGEHKHRKGEESLNITSNNLLIRLNKTQETRVLSVFITTAATSESV